MKEKEEQARWQQIWQDLGLTPEPVKASAVAKPPGAAEAGAEPVPGRSEPPRLRQEAEREDTSPSGREETAPVVEEQQPARGRRRRQVGVVDMHVEVPPAEPRSASAADVAETMPAALAGGEEPAAEKEGEEAAGRRRRNRRSRRGRSAEKAGEDQGEARTASAAEAEEAAAGETTADPLASPPEEADKEAGPAEDPDRRRRRGRGRKKAGAEREPDATEDSDPDAEVDAEFDSDEDEEPGASGPALDDEEMDDLANWSVPSWSELIASLYRPDR